MNILFAHFRKKGTLNILKLKNKDSIDISALVLLLYFAVLKLVLNVVNQSFKREGL